MEKFSKFVGAVVVGLSIIFLIALVFAFPTMWLWNWLMPMLFGVTKIGVLEALGVNLLTGILFRSSGSNKTSENGK